MARVLIVEDDLDIRNMVDKRLRRSGHQVVAVGSAAEAFAVLVGKVAPDIAVLDVRMPGMSGLDLLIQLRQDPTYAHMPAVFLSGRVQPEDIAAGQALGATYLTKPVVLNALLSAIDTALEPTDDDATGW